MGVGTPGTSVTRPVHSRAVYRTLESMMVGDGRPHLYKRVRALNCETVGGLDAAHRAKELQFLGPDDELYCSTLLRRHKRQVEPTRFTADIIYDRITFRNDLWQAVIDTPPFQRLRHLKQMGGACWVYPNAHHTRFEHSLGVGYLAGKWFRALRTQAHILGNSHEMESLHTGLEIAGLCHDLGHGPYSHAFESYVRSLPGREKWRHEDMSLNLLNYLIENPGESEGTCLGAVLDEMSGAVTARDIEQMIRGRAAYQNGDQAGSHYSPASLNDESPMYSPEEGLRRAAFTIVANKVDGFDVDRFDYLARDGMVAENLPRINPRRLMSLSAVNPEGQIIFSEKCQQDVYNFYSCRYYMYQNIYLHKNNQAVECMLRDILHHLDPILKIRDAVDHPAEYISLTDGCVLDWFGCTSRLKEKGVLSLEPEYEDRYRRAAAIVARMHRRQLYTYIGALTSNNPGDLDELDTAESILARCHFPKGALREEDIFVARAEISHGAPSGCPWTSVRFYKDDVQENFTMDEDAWPQYPSIWSTQKLLVYSRSENPVKWDYIRSGLRNACEQKPSLHCSPHHETSSSARFIQNRYSPTPSRRTV